jgi:hypothetical protein
MNRVTVENTVFTRIGYPLREEREMAERIGISTTAIDKNLAALKNKTTCGESARTKAAAGKCRREMYEQKRSSYSKFSNN